MMVAISDCDSKCTSPIVILILSLVVVCLLEGFSRSTCEPVDGVRSHFRLLLGKERLKLPFSRMLLFAQRTFKFDRIWNARKQTKFKKFLGGNQKSEKASILETKFQKILGGNQKSEKASIFGLLNVSYIVKMIKSFKEIITLFCKLENLSNSN